MTDKNCLSYWFPILEKGGIPVPKTQIIDTQVRLSELLDGKTPKGWKGFIAGLQLAIKEIGLPCFLRTGQGSGKHQWKDTCFIDASSNISHHIGRLVEW